MVKDKIPPDKILRIVISIRRQFVAVFVEGRGRVVIADGDDFKTDWTLKEILAKLNG